MAGLLSRNPKELKDLVLTRLGAPVVNVEVTEDQIYHCMQQAIELYGEYHSEGLNRSFVTVSGPSEGKQHTFNLSKYPIFAVTKILRSSSMNWTIDGTATYSWVNDFLQGLSGAGAGSTAHYSPLGGQGDLTTYSMLSSYQNLIDDMLNPQDNWWFDSGNRMLNMANGLGKGEALILEVYTASYIDPAESTTKVGDPYMNQVGDANNLPTDDDTYNNPYERKRGFSIGESRPIDQNVYNNRWVKDYTTAMVKKLNGYILSKNEGMQLPGGIVVNGTRLIQEADQEIATLRDELLLLQAPAAIQMG